MQKFKLLALCLLLSPLAVSAQSVPCQGVEMREINLVADDDTPIPAFNVRDPQYTKRSCELNSFSYPFLDLKGSGAPVGYGIWFSPQSVEAMLKGDKWWKVSPDKATYHDVVIMRSQGEIVAPYLIKSFQKNAEGEYMMDLAIKTGEGAPVRAQFEYNKFKALAAKKGHVMEIWSGPKTSKKADDRVKPKK